MEEDEGQVALEETTDRIVRWLRRLALDDPIANASADAYADAIEAGEPWRDHETGSGSSIRA